MHKHLTETELDRYKSLYETCKELNDDIKENRIKKTLKDFKQNDYIISTDDRGYQILKINKKSVKVRMYGIISPGSNRHFMMLKERITTLDIVTEAYSVTRDELALCTRYSRLNRRYGSYQNIVRTIELTKQADVYEQHENEQLDRYVEKYNLTKDCDCITHEGSCWIDQQRYFIERNANILRRAGWLCERSFAIEEGDRLSELAYQLEQLEHRATLSSKK